ncbi:unnamed protein product [Allacma fusca]|uniref:Uncharacterized protein n=1 Tax=Allacma fusca TaxID=39272 RepID=A0A8J2KPK5_9HEXA|nr:unnamed protein product [Allacma fusca]
MLRSIYIGAKSQSHGCPEGGKALKAVVQRVGDPVEVGNNWNEEPLSALPNQQKRGNLRKGGKNPWKTFPSIGNGREMPLFFHLVLKVGDKNSPGPKEEKNLVGMKMVREKKKTWPP